MNIIEIQTILFCTLSIILGGCIGSFIGAAAYRIPKGITLTNPKRSQCPGCQEKIPWHKNIPVISYLLQKGKCGCPKNLPLSEGYFLGEGALAILFGMAYLKWGMSPQTLLFWVIASLWSLGAIIDLSHKWLPDRTTLGTCAIIVLLYFFFPQLTQGKNPWAETFMTDGPWVNHFQGAALSLIWALICGFTMWGILELGKVFFGKKNFSTEGEETKITHKTSTGVKIQVGEETINEKDIFPRKTDFVILYGKNIQIKTEEETFIVKNLWISPDVIRFKQKGKLQEISTQTLESITGGIQKIGSPREAMGMGDVKLMTGIGAALGIYGAAMTLWMAAVLTIAFTAGAYLLKKRMPEQIAFGPPLIICALAWLYWM